MGQIYVIAFVYDGWETLSGGGGTSIRNLSILFKIIIYEYIYITDYHSITLSHVKCDRQIHVFAIPGKIMKMPHFGRYTECATQMSFPAPLTPFTHSTPAPHASLASHPIFHPTPLPSLRVESGNPLHESFELWLVLGMVCFFGLMLLALVLPSCCARLLHRLHRWHREMGRYQEVALSVAV